MSDGPVCVTTPFDASVTCAVLVDHGRIAAQSDIQSDDQHVEPRSKRAQSAPFDVHDGAHQSLDDTAKVLRHSSSVPDTSGIDSFDIVRALQARRRRALARRRWKRAVNHHRRSQDQQKKQDAQTGLQEVVAVYGKLIQGMSQQPDLLPLKPRYWLEMADAQHRVGLTYYHDAWVKSGSQRPFFYWLDHGKGRHLDLPEYPRKQLQRSRVRYMSAEEVDACEMAVRDGLLVWKAKDEPVHSISLVSMPFKHNWLIWVMDSDGRLLAAEKSKGTIQHSSLVCGAPVRCAGTMVVRKGKLKMINGWSGHYQPSAESVRAACDALQQRGINMKKVRVVTNHDGLLEMLMSQQDKMKRAWRKIWQPCFGGSTSTKRPSRRQSLWQQHVKGVQNFITRLYGGVPDSEEDDDDDKDDSSSSSSSSSSSVDSSRLFHGSFHLNARRARHLRFSRPSLPPYGRDSDDAAKPHRASTAPNATCLTAQPHAAAADNN